MSVALFSADELANAAAYILNANAQDMTPQWMRQIIQDVATFSQANAVAFARTYGEMARGVPAAEIAGALLDGRRFLRFACDKDRARSSLRLMRYNAISNEGTESTDVPDYDGALVRLLDAFACIMDDEMRELRALRAA